MSITLDPITVQAGSSVQVSLVTPEQLKALLVANKSQFDLQIQGFGVLGTRWLSAGMEILLTRQNANEGQLVLTAFNNANLSGVTSTILVTEYLADDPIPVGHWPVSIPTQVVSAQVSTVNNLVNDGNSEGTQVIEITAAAAPSSNVSILNNGSVTIKENRSGTMSTLLQLVKGAASNASNVILSASGFVTETLGNLKVNGIINLLPSSVSVNGQLSGTATLYEYMQGTVKQSFILFSNYQNNANQSLALPQAYTSRAWIQTTSCPPTAFLSSGVAQNVNDITALSSSGGSQSVITVVPSISIGQVAAGFDTIQLQPAGFTVNGMITIIGV